MMIIFMEVISALLDWRRCGYQPSRCGFYLWNLAELPKSIGDADVVPERFYQTCQIFEADPLSQTLFRWLLYNNSFDKTIINVEIILWPFWALDLLLPKSSGWQVLLSAYPLLAASLNKRPPRVNKKLLLQLIKLPGNVFWTDISWLPCWTGGYRAISILHMSYVYGTCWSINRQFMNCLYVMLIWFQNIFFNLVRSVKQIQCLKHFVR